MEPEKLHYHNMSAKLSYRKATETLLREYPPIPICQQQPRQYKKMTIDLEESISKPGVSIDNGITPKKIMVPKSI